MKKHVPLDPTNADLKSLKFENKLEESITAGQATKYIDLAVLLNYVRNFWTTVEFSSIHCEINFKGICSDKCIISRKAASLYFFRNFLY